MTLPVDSVMNLPCQKPLLNSGNQTQNGRDDSLYLRIKSRGLCDPMFYSEQKKMREKLNEVGCLVFKIRLAGAEKFSIQGHFPVGL